MKKTMKISELINMLEALKLDVGDKPIVMSRDNEGNGYNTIQYETDICTGYSNGIAILYPYDERNELDEIEGYDEEDV